jgi:hypothetical protein
VLDLPLEFSLFPPREIIQVTGMGASFLRESLVRAELDWREGAPIPEAMVENEEKMIAWRDIWSAGLRAGAASDS